MLHLLPGYDKNQGFRDTEKVPQHQRLARSIMASHNGAMKRGYTRVAQFITLCSASNLAEARRVASPW